MDKLSSIPGFTLFGILFWRHEMPSLSADIPQKKVLLEEFLQPQRGPFGNVATIPYEGIYIYGGLNEKVIHG